jgi:hypothetical protein
MQSSVILGRDDAGAIVRDGEDHKAAILGRTFKDGWSI